MERDLVHEGRDAFEQRVVAAQTGKVEVRQLDGGNLSAAQQGPEVSDRSKRQVVVGAGAFRRARNRHRRCRNLITARVGA
jgi:hypothetical protein